MIKYILLMVMGTFPIGCTKVGVTGGEPSSAASSSASPLSAATAVAGMDGSTGVIVTGDNENPSAETGDENDQEDQVEAGDCADFFSGKLAASLSKPLVMQDSVSLSKVEGEVVVSANTLTLEDIRGPVFALLQTSNQIDNLRGMLCLQGQFLNSTIGSAQLTNHRGRVEIEDLSMTLIQDTRGTLVITGGELKSLQNHRGNVQLIDVKVGDIDDVRGEIDLMGTSTVTGKVTNSDPLVMK
jgi:hypothetical protein